MPEAGAVQSSVAEVMSGPWFWAFVPLGSLFVCARHIQHLVVKQTPLSGLHEGTWS